MISAFIPCSSAPVRSLSRRTRHSRRHCSTCHPIALAKSPIDFTYPSSAPPHPLSTNAIADVYFSVNSTPYRGACAHFLAAAAAASQDSSRATVASFIKAARASEIVFADSANAAWRILAGGLNGPGNQGDEVLIAASCSETCFRVFSDANPQKVRQIDCEPNTGAVDLSKIVQNLTTRTKAIVLDLVNEESGRVHDLSEVIRFVKASGSIARVIVDVRLAVGRYPIDVESLNCDFAVGDSQGVNSASTIAFLYGKSDCLQHLCPIFGADESFADVVVDLCPEETGKPKRRSSSRRSRSTKSNIYQNPASWTQVPYRLEPGMPLLSAAASFAGAIRAFTACGSDRVTPHEHQLACSLMKRLALFEEIIVIGYPNPELQGQSIGQFHCHPHIGVVGFVVENVDEHVLAGSLERRGFLVDVMRHNDRKKYLLPALNGNQTLRVSFTMEHAIEDVERFVTALEFECEQLLGRPLCLAEVIEA